MTTTSTMGISTQNYTYTETETVKILYRNYDILGRARWEPTKMVRIWRNRRHKKKWCVDTSPNKEQQKCAKIICGIVAWARARMSYKSIYVNALIRHPYRSWQNQKWRSSRSIFTFHFENNTIWESARSATETRQVLRRNFPFEFSLVCWNALTIKFTTTTPYAKTLNFKRESNKLFGCTAAFNYIDGNEYLFRRKYNFSKCWNQNMSTAFPHSLIFSLLRIVDFQCRTYNFNSFWQFQQLSVWACVSTLFFFLFLSVYDSVCS